MESKDINGKKSHHDLTSQDIINLLELSPLDFEGGYYKRVWYSKIQGRSPQEGSALNYRQSSAIYYLMTSELEGYSRLHSLKQEESWHFYMGDPVEIYLFPNTDEAPKKIILGQDLQAHQRPFYMVEPGTVFGARLAPGGSWALLGNQVTPSFEIPDFKLIPKDKAINSWPEYQSWIDLFFDH
ncbi:MAG: cupin domain-containing protein [Spirochaetaceae bacterium]|jgi:predicted cupin superfamily sugar epimerase|nr:cupin domain-containing protein [Spirochaetaceae bacterium]